MNLVDQLIRDEGLRLDLYKDSVGKLTIGVGHNLSDKPITRAAALWILQDDIEDATKDLEVNLPWTKKLDPARFGALVNMAFNLGIGGLLKFKTTLGLIQEGKYKEASEAMLDSIWAKQVGARAERLSKQILTGEFQ